MAAFKLFQKKILQIGSDYENLRLKTFFSLTAIVIVFSCFASGVCQRVCVCWVSEGGWGGGSAGQQCYPFFSFLKKMSLGKKKKEIMKEYTSPSEMC